MVSSINAIMLLLHISFISEFYNLNENRTDNLMLFSIKKRCKYVLRCETIKIEIFVSLF